MARLKGLGRGLDALLAGNEDSVEQGDLRVMAISALVPGKYQPRTRMDDDALAELAESIREQGLMQPILVRETGGGHEIIAGERRWRAAQLAGLTEVPVLVRDIDDRTAAAMALIENIQREDLNAIDEARGLARLIEEFGLTHEAAARAVGKSRATVSNLLRLLQLDPVVQDMLAAGLIEMGHARALLPLAPPAQKALAQDIEIRGLSVRETERRVARLKAQPESPADPGTPSQTRDVARLEEALADALGMSVEVQVRRGGGGRVILKFAQPDELDGLLARLAIAL